MTAFDGLRPSYCGAGESESFLNDRVHLYCGDCREILATLPENTFDSCCCDPPYHLTSIVQRFGADNAAPAQFGKDGAYARASAGFMGKVWDGGDIAFRPETWAAVYRALKPGAYIVAFGSSRNYHRMACAIEDAGFITHPLIAWVFGQGFPKAHSVSKHIDRMAGAEREVVGRSARHVSGKPEQRTEGLCGSSTFAETVGMGAYETAPATDAAKQWDGWFYGTQSLKPALEPIYVGQKPFEKGLNGTQNILKWGTGAINVDGCRVGTNDRIAPFGSPKRSVGGIMNGTEAPREQFEQSTLGRWPANLCHDGSDEVVAAFPENTGNNGQASDFRRSEKTIYGEYADDLVPARERDKGSAARFFFQPKPNELHSAKRFWYGSKADSVDRIGSAHPTCKPLDLMQWLVRLVTPPNGKILDCFAGTGTTGEAAFREGFSAVLIEREAEYQADIRRRMALAQSGPDERARESIKAKNLPRDDGPLFGGAQ